MRLYHPAGDGLDAVGRFGAMSRIIRAPLHRIAHGRSGDKGNRQNISVIAYRPEAWSVLLREVTEARVHALFRHRGVTAVRRYELPKLMALNFVLDDALEGGVNAALALDSHGKTASFRLLSLEIDVPAELLSETAGDIHHKNQKLGGQT